MPCCKNLFREIKIYTINPVDTIILIGLSGRLFGSISSNLDITTA
jgi:CheY-specific phosphatase CheX